MDHGEHFGEIGSVVQLSKVRSHGILVLSVRLSCIAIHSQHTGPYTGGFGRFGRITLLKKGPQFTL